MNVRFEILFIIFQIISLKMANQNYPFFKVSDMNTFGNEKYMNFVYEYVSESYKRYLLENQTL